MSALSAFMCCSILLSAVACTNAPVRVSTSERAPVIEPVPRTHQYPSGEIVRFTTWSLFLVCDPTWGSVEEREDLIRLYTAYINIGIAANKDHAPLWPFRVTPGGDASEIDPSKSRPYCEALRLDPSHAPFVIITAHPPDSIGPSDPKILLSFGNRRGQDITTMLLALSERMGDQDLAKTKAGSREWWLAWGKVSNWMRCRFWRFRGATMSVQAPKEGK